MRGHRSGACHPSVQLKAKPGPTLGLAKQEELSRYGVPLPLLPALLLTNYRVVGLVQVMTSKVANYVATAVARASPNLHDMYADPPPTRIVRTRMSRPAHYRNYRPATSSESFVTTVQLSTEHRITHQKPKSGGNTVHHYRRIVPKPLGTNPAIEWSLPKGTRNREPIVRVNNNSFGSIILNNKKLGRGSSI